MSARPLLFASVLLVCPPGASANGGTVAAWVYARSGVWSQQGKIGTSFAIDYPSLRPSLIAGRTDFTYFPGAVRIPESSAVNTKNTSHTITATIEVPKGGADGVLVAEGGAAGGFTLYVRNGRPVYEYNFMAHERYRIAGSEKLAPGHAVIRVDFKSDGGVAKGGMVTLYVNDRKVGEGRVEKTILARFGNETFDVGMDEGSPVSEEYQSPFPYSGAIEKVRVQISPAALSAQAREGVRNAERRVALGIQ